MAMTDCMRSACVCFALGPRYTRCAGSYLSCAGWDGLVRTWYSSYLPVASWVLPCPQVSYLRHDILVVATDT
eukprot:6202898-Pleurochrysis_carterae.AAC.5